METLLCQKVCKIKNNYLITKVLRREKSKEERDKATVLSK